MKHVTQQAKMLVDTVRLIQEDGHDYRIDNGENPGVLIVREYEEGEDWPVRTWTLGASGSRTWSS